MLLRLKPEQNEGFGSYLLRLASRNLIRTKKELHAEIGLAPLSAKQGTELIEDMAVFKRATGLSKAEIQTLVPTILEGGDICVRHLHLKEFHFQTIRRRYGVMHLRTAKTCHYAWQIDLLPICPTSFEVLRDRCPGCLHALEWPVSRGPSYCDDCGYNLTLVEPVMMEDDERQLAKPIMDYVFGDEVQKKQAELTLPPLFRHFDGAVLLQLVIIFGRAARYLNGDVREFRNRYDYASTLAEFLEGARLIIGAPDALHEVMRSESRFRASKFLGEVKRYARQIGTVAAQEAAVGIAKALKPDAPRHISAISTARKKHGLLTLKEMAADMGLPDKSKIKALVDAGLLSSETQPGDFKRITYVRRIEFERLKASIADRVSSVEVSQATGWKAYHLEQFVDAGLLEWHPSQAIPHLYCREYVERDPFEALVRRIRTQIPNLPAEDERISLSKLYPVIGATHKPLATVVKTALTFNNQLELGIVDPSGPLVAENLSVPMRLTGSVVKGDVPWYQLPFTRPYMMQEEVQEYLNLLPKNLFQLLRCGILEYASFNRVRIATDTVVQAGVDYIGAWEIAARIGNTAKQSARWAQERDLKKPSKDHDLWRREDVEVFLPANRYLTHVPTTTKPAKRMPQFGPEIEEEECPGVRRPV